jgi:SAM-dependent methyltransferase
LSSDLVSIIFYALAAFIGYFFLTGFIWGAGFQPTPKKDVDLAAELLGLREGKLVYDLGSGTGDVVLRLAKKYRVGCIGIEIDPLKVLISRLRIALTGDLRTAIQVKRSNLLSVDLSNADAIYLFLSGGRGIMTRLEPKLLRELKEDAKIASYVHTFENWEPVIAKGEIRVYSVAMLRNRAHSKETGK